MKRLARYTFWFMLLSLVVSWTIITILMRGGLLASKGPRSQAKDFNRKSLEKKATENVSIERNDLNVTFIENLQQRNFTNQTVILALVDYGFVDLAMNFYQTSLKPFQIQNYLFVGASRKACDEIVAHNVKCYTYIEDATGNKASVYGSKDFLRKMNIRTDMILDAMSIGTTVVHTDLDVVFLRNPLPDLESHQGDLVTMWDKSVYNAGFLIVRPTVNGIWIYKKVREITKASKRTNDQAALNKAIRACHKTRHGCKVTSLPTTSYSCGYEYFERGGRMFAGQNPCPNCTVVHNNWIVSKEAKVYRFKENLMWWNDQDGYYSSNTTMYLTYSNPLLRNNTQLRQLETDALRNALSIGYILNRIVILPKFHCSTTYLPCPLNSLFLVSRFDSMFDSQYRENSFLNHFLVPKSVKSSVSVTHRIKMTSNITELEKHILSSKVVTPSGPDGATADEVKQWFSGVQERVLVFEHLYKAFAGFDNADKEIQNKLEKCLKGSSYRQ